MQGERPIQQEEATLSDLSELSSPELAPIQSALLRQIERSPSPLPQERPIGLSSTTPTFTSKMEEPVMKLTRIATDHQGQILIDQGENGLLRATLKGNFRCEKCVDFGLENCVIWIGKKDLRVAMCDHCRKRHYSVNKCGPNLDVLEIYTEKDNSQIINTKELIKLSDRKFKKRKGDFTLITPPTSNSSSTSSNDAKRTKVTFTKSASPSASSSSSADICTDKSEAGSDDEEPEPERISEQTRIERRPEQIQQTRQTLPDVSSLLSVKPLPAMVANTSSPLILRAAVTEAPVTSQANAHPFFPYTNSNSMQPPSTSTFNGHHSSQNSTSSSRQAQPIQKQQQPVFQAPNPMNRTQQFARRPNWPAYRTTGTTTAPEYSISPTTIPTNMMPPNSFNPASSSSSSSNRTSSTFTTAQLLCNRLSDVEKILEMSVDSEAKQACALLVIQGIKRDFGGCREK